LYFTWVLPAKLMQILLASNWAGFTRHAMLRNAHLGAQKSMSKA